MLFYFTQNKTIGVYDRGAHSTLYICMLLFITVNQLLLLRCISSGDVRPHSARRPHRLRQLPGAPQVHTVSVNHRTLRRHPPGRALLYQIAHITVGSWPSPFLLQKPVR